MSTLQDALKAAIPQAGKGCYGKMRYWTQEAARRVADRRQLEAPEDGPLHVYECKKCGRFHITKQPQHYDHLTKG